MQVKINKASRYAPIRYEATRPYAVRLGQAFLAAHAKGEQARLAFVQRPLMELVQQAVARMGRANGPGPVQAELLNVQAFGSFLSAGKVIFDIDPALTKALIHTDAENIPCGELPLPCESFYLHFGIEQSEVDGMFITRLAPDRIGIELVLPGWGAIHFFSIPAGEPLLPMTIDLSDPEKPIQTALADTMQAIADKNAEIYAQMAALERQLTEQYGEVVKVPDPLEHLKGKDGLMRRSLALAVNALFYLASETQDMYDDWGADTPLPAREALAAATTAGHIKTLTNTLTKAGYRKVRLVGRQFARSAEYEHLGDAIKTGRTLATHFRRGHFKRQAHGPARSLRKHIFIAPVMVNVGKGGEVQGRIYEVKDVQEIQNAMTQGARNSGLSETPGQD